MTDSKDIHNGHRRRMFAKYLASKENFPDHELLEILLFFAIPRSDTNKLSHLLIHRFGNIEKVFEAHPEELTSIEGIGIKTAEYLSILGQVLKIIKRQSKTNSHKVYASFDDNKNDAIAYFKNIPHEHTYISLLDGNYREITRICYEQKDISSVKALIPDVAKAFAIHKPIYTIVAHNHPSKNPEPSPQDDFTTAKLNMLCSIHGVGLVDHIIVADKTAFSYFSSGRLQEIKKKFNLDDIVNKI